MLLVLIVLVSLKVLRFNDNDHRQSFLTQLKTFLDALAIALTEIAMPQARIFSGAETREKRQKLLDKFFRIISLQVCIIIHKATFLFNIPAKEPVLK